MEANIPLPSPLPDQDGDQSALGTVINNNMNKKRNSCCKKDSSIHNGASSSTMWTDEKHGSYLSSLEASFVNQLNRWINSRGRLDDLLLRASCPSPGQFTDLQDGCWQKFGSDGDESLVESTADSHIVSAGKELCDSPCSCCQRRHLESGLAHLVCPQDPVSAALEVSDQNFLDKDQKSCHMPTSKRSKRLKCRGHDSSTNDNVAFSCKSSQENRLSFQ